MEYAEFFTKVKQCYPVNIYSGKIILLEGSFLSRQKFHQLLHGPAPVADAVFLLGRHLGKGLVIAFGNKDRVIAEANRSAGGLGDVAFYNAIELMHLPL